jgi:hypothetical protein
VSLRQGLVEAAAKTSYAADAWDHVDEMQRILWWIDAKLALDAILDYLEANADEWSYQATLNQALLDPTDSYPLALVAALRMQENQP